MKLRSVHRVAPILFFFSIAGFAQEPTSAPIRSEQEKHAYLKAMEEADQKIANEVKTHSELIKNLEYLTTRIGATPHRVTPDASRQRVDAEAFPRLRC